MITNKPTITPTLSPAIAPKAITAVKPIVAPIVVPTEVSGGVPTKRETFQDILVRIALEDLDIRELPRNSNRGPKLLKFFAADDYDPNGNKPGDEGYPWCAAAVCFWVQQAMEEWERQHGKPLTFKAPRTAAAFGFEEWSLKQDKSTLTRFSNRNPRIGGDIRKGDIVILKVSHICITTHGVTNGVYRSVEGNTNDEGSREGYEVALRKRTLSGVRSVIRFNVD